MKASDQDGRSVPTRLPSVRVVVAHRSADLGVGGEASARRLHLDTRRFEWELGWEDELAMVLSARVWSVRGPRRM